MNLFDNSVTNLICNQYCKVHPCEEDFTNLPRPYYSFTYILKGSLKCVTNTYTVLAGEGDIIFFPYRIQYKLTWLEPNTTVYACHFNFPAFSEPFGNKEFPLQKISGQADCLEYFQYIYENIKHEDFFLGVLGTFYMLCSRFYPLLSVQRVLYLDDRIKKAVEYIHTNYRKHITIDELSALCHLSPSRFHYCFKKETGMSAIEYKNHICIKQAALMLLDNIDTSIEEISAQCGFQSSEYFRRTFKAIMGKNPREYRSSMKTAL